MAFDKDHFAKSGPGLYRYDSDDDLTTVLAANYFSRAHPTLQVGDIIDYVQVVFDSRGNITTILAIYRLVITQSDPRGSGGVSAAVQASDYTGYPAYHVRYYGAKGDGVTDDSDAIASAFQAVNDAGGGIVEFAPGATYLVNSVSTFLDFENVRIRGNGATIRARLSQIENVWTFLDADGVQIDGFIFDGGYSITTFSNQILSFRDPKNCTVRNCRFSDWERTAVLMFSADRNSSGEATNNFIIDCTCDGLEAAAAGYIMESMDASSMVNCWAFGIRDNATGPNYALEFKDQCTRCSMIGGAAVNSTFGVVMADDGSIGTDGSGANDCIVRGTMAIACLTGFTGNYMGHCSVEMEIDQQDIADGVRGVEIGAHGLKCHFDVALKRHTNCSVACVDTRSDDMSVFVREWDRTGAVLWLIETGVERNRLSIRHIDTNSATFSPLSVVTDNSGASGGNANFLQDLRNFPYSEISGTSASMYFDVPGQNRGTHVIRMADNQFVVRTGGTDRVQFNNANSGWYPAADAVYDSGIASRRWRNTYTQAMALVDGVAAPASIAGHAVIYVDTADGDLKVKFSDGTVKTIVVDT